MRKTISDLLRLGPSFAYAIGLAFLVSMVLLAAYPASPLVWSIYMTMLPIVREPIYLLLSVPGVDLPVAAVILAATALAGVYLSIRPRRFASLGFVHAHVALLALIFAMGRAATAQADSAGFIFPRLVNGDWVFLPISFPPLGAALFLFVLAGCAVSHVAVIGRARARARAARHTRKQLVAEIASLSL